MSSTDPNEAVASGSTTLARLVVALLKIGSIGFGGGMAVIALMEDEFVRKRRLERRVRAWRRPGQILGPLP